MLAEFKCLNDEHVTEHVVGGPADVNALYPSLDIAFTVEKVCEIFYTSDIHIVDLEVQELALYVALNRTEAELDKLGFLLFCPRRKTTSGSSLVITGCVPSDCRDERFGPWLPPFKEPGEQIILKMFTEAMKMAFVFIMKNHMYTFDNKINL